MNLKQYADLNNIKYRAAWNRYKAGKIPQAYQDKLGRILIPEKNSRQESVAVYCRVSSSQNKTNLDKQKDRLISYCLAKGYKVDFIVLECASGLNDKRPKLLQLLKNKKITRIVVEHSDRLTRFGFNYIDSWMSERNIEIEIVNKADDDKKDLMEDFVSLVTSFTARLYGQRRTKRKTEQLIKELENENSTKQQSQS